MADKTIDLLLRLSLDKSQQAEVKAGIKSIEQALTETVQRANQLRETTQRIQQVGMQVGALGAAALAPLILSAKKYVDKVGDGEQTSRRMLRVMERWENVQVRIGRVTADTLLPVLEKALEITEKIAAYAEKNPDAIKGTLITGATLATVGGLVASVSGIVGTVATLKGLGAAGALAKVGGAAGPGIGAGVKAFAAGAGGAALLGVGAGILGYNAIAERNNMSSAGTIGGQFASVGAGIAGYLVGGQDTAREWARVIGEATGVIEKQSTALTKYAEIQKAISAETQKYQKDRAQLEIKLAKETGAEVAKIESNSADQRIAIANELSAALSKAESGYTQERAETLRDSGAEIQRIEQDSQRRIQQIKRTSARQENDAIRNRDALGLIEAQRAREEEIDQERENTAVEISRRREDLAIKLRDLDASYRRERDSLMMAANQKLIDLRNAENREILELRAHQENVLAELRAAYYKQISLIRQTLGANGGNMGTNRDGRGIARAAGGYMPTGLYDVSERGREEFAMSHQTTRAAENIIGGRLTQDKLLQALTMNVNLSNGMTIVQARRMMAANNNDLINQFSRAFGSI